MVTIKHLSISVTNPERSAKALAEMTGGHAETFSSKNMPGGWVCVWDHQSNHLIEFLPNNYLLYETDYGADFKKLERHHYFNSTHIQLEIARPVNEIISLAEKYGFSHKFRPSRGGPLYDVWLEEEFLVEFVSDEIRSMLT